MAETDKICLQCSKPMRSGRQDKKFCDDYCRSVYNNRNKKVIPESVKKINSILIHNREVLKDLLDHETGKSKVHENKLVEHNFDFRYHTHNYTTQKGQVYLFWYEYGYLPLEGGYYLVVKRDE